MTRFLRRLLIASLISLFSIGCYQLPWFYLYELLAVDLWFQIRAPISPPEEVILIAMDEASYDELGLPMNEAWPRAVHAELLKRLSDAGAKRVVFDVAFLGPSSSDEADQELANAFGLLPTAIGVDAGLAPGNEEIEEVYLPYEPFQQTVSELALVGLPEQKGYIRRFKSQRNSVTGKYRSLAEAGANLRTGAELPDRDDLINHYGPAGTIITHSYADVLAPDFLPDSEFADKVVYVGLILRTELGPAQKDSFLTPYQARGRTFGVEIHAASALNLIHQNWIKRYDWRTETIIIGVGTLVLSLILLSLSPGLGLTALIVLTIGWIFGAYYSFLNHQMIPGLTLFGFIAPLVYLISTTTSYLTARRKQKQTEQAFSYYLSPEMAREVAANPDALNLGGTTVEATAIFTDIADFTKISESMKAEEVVEMLNAYFTEVMDEIFLTKGTLIKFIGDAVFALWGAPIPLKDHPSEALKTAIAIRKKVQEFNTSENYPELFTRIGVHTGPMVVGNLGSAKRFDYTGIGDAVNLAARLEGLNKYFGTDILYSDSVHSKLSVDPLSCSLGRVSVKGKSEVVTVHTVVPEDVDDDVVGTWREGLTLFHDEKWDESLECFKTLLAGKTYFKTAASLYLQQIPYRKISGTEGWQGEIAFDVK